MNPPTVAEIIAQLSKLPQDLPCFVRLKYHGSSDGTEDIPVHIHGISEMHPEGKPKNVTFLI